MIEKYNPETVVLDEEEQWYEDHAEEFVPGKPEDRVALMMAAKNTMAEIENKTERMNIRMTRRDIAALKARAEREGLPNQSLVASVLHKFMNGRLVDIEEARKVLQW